jgi:hypothetical protein
MPDLNNLATLALTVISTATGVFGTTTAAFTMFVNDKEKGLITELRDFRMEMKEFNEKL